MSPSAEWSDQDGHPERSGRGAGAESKDARAGGVTALRLALSLSKGVTGCRLVALLLLLSLPALAGSRARYGGSLHLALSGKPVEAEALYADTPAEAALLALTSRSLCAPPFTITRQGALTLRLEVPAPLKAQDVAAALQRVRTEATPYRALLAPVSQLTANGAGVDLRLSHPWPDLESALCHPALAVPGAGPFKLGSAAPGRYAADLQHPAGRPYLDEVVVTSTDDRGAERLFAQRKAQLAVSLPPREGEKATLLYATGLLYAPTLPPGFRAAFEASVDRADLVRFFVRPPAAPLPPGPPPPRPPALSPPREVTLLYDMSLDDQRAVAARLQVRLNPLGYRVALKALGRRELRARWAKGDYELMLFSVLLPPRASNALAVALEVARAPDAVTRQLAQLQLIADDEAREERARELLVSLSSQLPALPLYVQGLSLQAAPQVQGLKLDGYGLPKLDDVFLGPG